jgi:t-SNARE complex subunit (syntaxin)
MADLNGSSSSGAAGDLVSKELAEQKIKIKRLEEVSEEITKLYDKLSVKQSRTEDIVQLGWIVIVITALGVAMSLFSLIIAFFTYFKPVN